MTHRAGRRAGEEALQARLSRKLGEAGERSIYLFIYFGAFHLSGPSLPRVRPRALPADRYQASGPYCIADGADRRERRQPAWFLEG